MEDGTPVIETPWHRIIAWNCTESISKGDKVHVLGRLRASHYVDDTGNRQTFYEVFANSVKVIDR